MGEVPPGHQEELAHGGESVAGQQRLVAQFMDLRMRPKPDLALGILQRHPGRDAPKVALEERTTDPLSPLVRPDEAP